MSKIGVVLADLRYQLGIQQLDGYVHRQLVHNLRNTIISIRLAGYLGALVVCA